MQAGARPQLGKQQSRSLPMTRLFQGKGGCRLHGQGTARGGAVPTLAAASQRGVRQT